jgi:hypothetical protein
MDMRSRQKLSLEDKNGQSTRSLCHSVSGPSEIFLDKWLALADTVSALLSG